MMADSDGLLALYILRHLLPKIEGMARAPGVGCYLIFTLSFLMLG